MKLSDRIAKYYNLEVETRVVKGIESNILEIYKILQLYNITKIYIKNFYFSNVTRRVKILLFSFIFAQRDSDNISYNITRKAQDLRVKFHSNLEP